MRRPLRVTAILVASLAAPAACHRSGGQTGGRTPSPPPAASAPARLPAASAVCQELVQRACSCPTRRPGPASAPIDDCHAAKGLADALAFQRRVVAGQFTGPPLSSAMKQEAEAALVHIVDNCRQRLAALGPCPK